MDVQPHDSIQHIPSTSVTQSKENKRDINFPAVDINAVKTELKNVTSQTNSKSEISVKATNKMRAILFSDQSLPGLSVMGDLPSRLPAEVAKHIANN